MYRGEDAAEKFVRNVSTPKGLDGLAKTLADDESRYLRESCTSNHFGLIRRQGVYPYDYVDSFDRFEQIVW